MNDSDWITQERAGLSTRRVLVLFALPFIIALLVGAGALTVEAYR